MKRSLKVFTICLLSLPVLMLACSDDLACGDGTVEKDGKCIADAAAPDSGASGGADSVPTAGLSAQRKPQVQSVQIVDAVSRIVSGDKLHGGYPLAFNGKLTVTGEPFRTDLYVGLRTDKGEGCILGIVELTHQPKAFELAAAAQAAQSTAKGSGDVGSFADCSEDKSCAEADESCIPADATGKVVAGVTGSAYNAALKAVGKDGKSGTDADRSTVSAAMLASGWRCMTEQGRTFAQKPAPSPLDFGSVKTAQLDMIGEFPVQQQCDGIAGSKAKVWVAFDPFGHTDFAQRAKLDDSHVASIDYTTGLNWVMQQRNPLPKCAGKCDFEVAKSPGADFHLRGLHLGSSVLLPHRKMLGAAHVDISLFLESSIYGQLDESRLKKLAEESVELAITLTATGAPELGCDASGWDGKPRKVDFVLATKGKAGEKPTIEELEAWIKSKLVSLSINSTGYNLRFSDALRKELTQGPLRCFQSFSLAACAAPDFKEASGAGIGKANNCSTTQLLILQQTLPDEVKKLLEKAGSGDANGSCVGSCGGSGGGCWCDNACVNYGDCCADYQQVCNAASGTTGAATSLPTTTKPVSSACKKALDAYTAASVKQKQLEESAKPSRFYMLNIDKHYPFPTITDVVFVWGKKTVECPKTEKEYMQAHESGLAAGNSFCGQPYPFFLYSPPSIEYVLCCFQGVSRYKMSLEKLPEKIDGYLINETGCRLMRSILSLSECPTTAAQTEAALENFYKALGSVGPTFKNYVSSCEKRVVAKSDRYTVDDDGKITVMEDDRAFLNDSLPLQCLADKAKNAASAAFNTMVKACAEPKPVKPSMGWFPKTTHLLQDLNYEKQWGPSGLKLVAEMGLKNELVTATNGSGMFAITLGPHARMTLNSSGVLSGFSISHIFQAYALIHAYSDLGSSFFELKLHALTKDIIVLDLKIPDGFEVPEPPVFSKEKEKCKSFNAHCVIVRVCGALGGSLGLKDVTGTWKGVLTVPTDGPKLDAEAKFNVTPFVKITAAVSVGVDLALGVLGLKLIFDPVVELNFPATASFNLSLAKKGSNIVASVTPGIVIKLVAEVIGGGLNWFWDGRLTPDADGELFGWDPIKLYETTILDKKQSFGPSTLSMK